MIIPTRDRAEMLRRTIPIWEKQELPLIILTEPGQGSGYAHVLADLKVDAEILEHPEPDRGLGYARAHAVDQAIVRGLDAFIMADDDCVVRGNDDVRKMLSVVASERAICCGGWFSVHSLWYGRELGKQPDRLVAHSADKLYAVNPKLASFAGNYDERLRVRETPGMTLSGFAAGYLWWAHTGVHIRELNPVGSPGGIAADPRGDTRQEKLDRDHAYLYEVWGSRYVSAPGSMYSTNARQMISDFIGAEGVDAHMTKRPFSEDDPLLPRRDICSRQLGLDEALA